MTKILTKSYADTRLQIAYALIGAGIFTILVYGINIYRVVSTTVMIRETEKSIAALGSKVQELDSRYLQLSGNLGPERIKSLGLHEVQVSDYISRSTSLGRVALLPHEL